MATETCYNCVYSYWDRCQAVQGFTTGFGGCPACANQPESLGRMSPTPVARVCHNYRPRPPEPGGDARRIPLGDGLYAYVDAADYEWLSRYTWSAVNGYAARNEKGKLVYMHRQIMNASPGEIVDHHNHNKLDDTRANLRICTGPENQRNQRKKRGSVSKYKGVGYSKDRHKWYAQIHMMHKEYWLGYHATEIEAARAYDRKAVELFGEFANLNFPEEWPPERRREVHAAAQQEHKKLAQKQGKKETRARPGRGNSSSARKSSPRKSSPRTPRKLKKRNRR